MVLLSDRRWEGKVSLGGELCDAGAGSYPVVEPATGAELGRAGQACEDDVEEAVRRAVRAQREWAAKSHRDRAAVLRRAGDAWLSQAGEVQDWLVREAGSIRPKAEFETGFAANTCLDAAGLAGLPYGNLLRSTEPRLSMARRVPVGVVGVISPFNFPLILSIRAVAPALALGNAVVLKPDPRTAVCGGMSLASVFEEAGLPSGLLSVVPGGAAVGEAMLGNPAVQQVSFTGSTRVGRKVATIAAARLKRVHLELGGNSAMIVLDDVDPEAAASIGAWGSFNHQGQICMATGRHLVDARIAGDYVNRLAEHASRLAVGDPYISQVALGPLIDAAQRDLVHSRVTASVAAGARLVAGGSYEGLFYPATVLADVALDSPAYSEEVFGPVAPVVSFESLDQVVELASSGEYGLSLSIVTNDIEKALYLADRIPAGAVHINGATVDDEGNNPFGGVKSSGAGSRLGGVEANMEAFTELQWLTLSGRPASYPF
jgi:benzaldehyde dehydrogenase (NAD)